MSPLSDNIRRMKTIVRQNLHRLSEFSSLLFNFGFIVSIEWTEIFRQELWLDKIVLTLPDFGKFYPTSICPNM